MIEILIENGPVFELNKDYIDAVKSAIPELSDFEQTNETDRFRRSGQQLPLYTEDIDVSKLPIYDCTYDNLGNLMSFKLIYPINNQKAYPKNSPEYVKAFLIEFSHNLTSDNILSLLGIINKYYNDNQHNIKYKVIELLSSGNEVIVGIHDNDIKGLKDQENII